MIEMIVCRSLELVITAVAVAFAIHAYFRLQKEIEDGDILRELLALRNWREFTNNYKDYEFLIATPDEVILYKKII